VALVAKRDLHKVLFPKQRKILSIFGEDLLLAMKRRGFTKKMLCERTGFDHKTVSKVFTGDPGVAIGTYLKIMAVLGMENNFAELAAHDELGIKLQNIKLLEGSK
jgi:transcriptional regulator with XRE-family HTH domain